MAVSPFDAVMINVISFLIVISLFVSFLFLPVPSIPILSVKDDLFTLHCYRNTSDSYLLPVFLTVDMSKPGRNCDTVVAVSSYKG